MPTVSRSFVALAFVLAGGGMRQRTEISLSTKYIAGVPVHNYDKVCFDKKPPKHWEINTCEKLAKTEYCETRGTTTKPWNDVYCSKTCDECKWSPQAQWVLMVRPGTGDEIVQRMCEATRPMPAPTKGQVKYFLTDFDATRCPPSTVWPASAHHCEIAGKATGLQFSTGLNPLHPGGCLAFPQTNTAFFNTKRGGGSMNGGHKMICEGDDSGEPPQGKRNSGCDLAGHPTGGVPFIAMHGAESDVEAVIMEGNGAVEYVEPDVETFADSEAEMYSDAPTWGLKRIGAYDREDRFGGKGVTIFLFDTGVRATHSEFQVWNRAIPTLDMTGGNEKRGWECNGDRSCANDFAGHGTHIAGIAAGSTYGVAPLAQIRAMKVLRDDMLGKASMLIFALDWMVARVDTFRPAVASISMGGENSRVEAYAVNAAVNAGISVVVAAGNENTDACSQSPASVQAAITVGSVTSFDRRHSLSNFGKCVDIWAPGTDIVSAGILFDYALDTMSGTSMACPHVSGGVALLLSEDPNMNPSEVWSALSKTSEYYALHDLKIAKEGGTNRMLNVRKITLTPPPKSCPWGCKTFRTCWLDECKWLCSFC